MKLKCLVLNILILLSVISLEACADVETDKDLFDKERVCKVTGYIDNDRVEHYFDFNNLKGGNSNIGYWSNISFYDEKDNVYIFFEFTFKKAGTLKYTCCKNDIETGSFLTICCSDTTYTAYLNEMKCITE